MLTFSINSNPINEFHYMNNSSVIFTIEFNIKVNREKIRNNKIIIK